MTWQTEEVIGLIILLAVVVGLSLAGKLTHDSVDALKWVGAAFFASKGAANFLPERKDP